MSANSPSTGTWISEEDYLAGELTSEIKHEYVDGYVYAMAGASRNHERIAGNVYREFGNHLKNKPCEPFSSDLKIKTGSRFFYPDVMVVCAENKQHDYYTESPVIIVEVLSKSSRRMDETTKRIAYQSIPGLKEFVLIEQDFVDVEVCRKSEGWVSNHYFMGDSVRFDAIDLTLTVEEIYARVDNDEVRSYFQEQQAQL
ncbi:MAG TPA: Uma2 family endonuclease [Methylobacter sp.]|jgi:Uma2 family endonuclease